MGAVIFILFVLVFFIGGGWLLGRSLGGFLSKSSENKPTFVDKSINHHYHNYDFGNKTIHEHTHQNLTVIDEETHRKGLDYFSNKKDSSDE